MKERFRIVVLLLTTQWLLSCSFYPPVKADDPQSIINGVRIGEEVIIVSHRGKISQFVVTRMTNKALYGEGYRVGYDEIRSIEVEDHPSVLGELFGSKSRPEPAPKPATKPAPEPDVLPEVAPATPASQATPQPTPAPEAPAAAPAPAAIPATPLSDGLPTISTGSPEGSEPAGDR